MRNRAWWLRGKHFVVVVTWVLVVGCGGGKKGAGDVTSLLRLGQEQMQDGRYREAVASFKKAASLDPDAAEPYRHLALIYQECLDDPMTALRYYRKYQDVEKDGVKKEEVRGWMVQLEREVGEVGEKGRSGVSPGVGIDPGTTGAGGSKGPDSRGRSDPTGSVPEEESRAYKDLQARLESALREIGQLKAQRVPESGLVEKLAEAEQRIEKLGGEKESLAKSLREARADALRNQQAALQADQRKDELRGVYEAQMADLKRRLNVAEARLRDMQAGGKEVQAAQSGAAEKIARLEKMQKTYAATLSSLQKVNDELRKENAALRSRLGDRGGRVRYHTVRTGETLKKIAGYRSVYGDSRKWVFIYHANRDKVGDPNKLAPGLVLVIPPG